MGIPSDFDILTTRFYTFIEDAYTHANRTLLQLLLKDQQLIPRLRSLKHYFFLSQSSFLTHLLDLSHVELRKSAKSASIVKLQSLLDLALNSDGGVIQGEDVMFREDVRVTMAGSGLYEWLLKVVSVSGVIGGEDGEPTGDPVAHEENKREMEKDDKKPMLGEGFSYLPVLCSNVVCFSDRCSRSRLQRQISFISGDLAENNPSLSTYLPFPFASQTCRTIAVVHVDRAEGGGMAAACAGSHGF